MRSEYIVYTSEDMEFGMREEYANRNSRIEAIKLVAMLLIVINHVTRSIQPAQYYPDSGYSILLSSASHSIQQFILNLFCYFGSIGNAIFLISSIWFLLESNKVKSRKVKHLVIDTWVVSVVLCALFVIFWRNGLPKVLIVKSLFPIICCNNWYITCYLILYLIHPLLNLIIERIERARLFKLNVGLFIAYFVIAFVSESLLYYSNLIFFMSSYLIVGYMKKYSCEYTTNVKMNRITIVISACACVALLGVTWIASKYVPALRNKMLMWTSNNNPFTFFMAFSVFNLARRKEWCSAAVNKFSSLTLLIYIIHENIYIKNLLRPYIWERLYIAFGHTRVVLVDIMYSVIFFVVTCVIAFGYRLFNRVVSYKVLGPVYDGIEKCINKKSEKL